MPMSIGLDELRRLIDQAGESWQAGQTSQFDHSDAQARSRLGYVPGPNDRSLEEAEQVAAAAAAAAPAAPPGAPAQFDWRNMGGQNYVTPIEDQAGCGSCVAFGAIAALESLVRITRHAPGAAVDLSEAHLFFCYGPNSGAGRCPDGGWWPDAAFDSLKAGVVDSACFPYTDADQPCNLCPGWRNRVTKISGWHTVDSQADMKAFLSTVGPMSACFTIYEDFYYSYTGGVYRHVSGNRVGGHCVCIIGYNDTQNCWIAKNSWGTGWGENGFFRIGYGQCGIDDQMWAPEGIFGWSELYRDSDQLVSVRVGANADGRLEVLGVNAQGRIWHTWQKQPNGAWVGSWSELYKDSDQLSMLDVGRNADGRLEVFGVDPQGHIRHTAQTDPNGAWVGSWGELYRDADTLATLDVGSNADGRLELVGVNAQQHIWHTWQTQPSGPW